MSLEKVRRNSSGKRVAGFTAGVLLRDLSISSHSVLFPTYHWALFSNVLFRERTGVKGERRVFWGP